MKEYRFTIGGKKYAVDIKSISGSQAEVNVNGRDYTVELENDAPTPASVPAAQAPAPAESTAAPAVAQSQAKPAGGASKDILSPMPGVIIEICVKEGQQVKAGQKVAVLEAMKMENEILAEKDGIISGVFVTKGDSVLEGNKIVTID